MLYNVRYILAYKMPHMSYLLGGFLRLDDAYLSCAECHFRRHAV